MPNFMITPPDTEFISVSEYNKLPARERKLYTATDYTHTPYFRKGDDPDVLMLDKYLELPVEERKLYTWECSMSVIPGYRRLSQSELDTKARIKKLRNKPYNCMCCGKPLERSGSGAFEGGVEFSGEGGYGSVYDTTSFTMAICDDCIEQRIKGKSIRKLGSWA